MKKISFLLILILNSLESQQIESIVKLKPEIQYDESLRYEKIEEVKLNNEKNEKNFDFGFNLDINKEERTINGIKFDLIFKGIDYGTTK
ncbi:MAG: hypothetical protein KBE77_04280 [Aliarcobacter sp.]|nr:hypothetical protein [Aliarcobacter sp.]